MKTTMRNVLEMFFGSTLTTVSCFCLEKTKHHNQVKLLTSANYVTTSCLPIACQSKGLKWLLIFCNPKH